MTDRLDQLRARLQAARDAMEEEFEARRAAIRYRVEGARVVFEEDVLAAHRAARENLADFLRRTRPMVVLTAPVIYALVVPLAALDLCVTLYQRVCFPVYGIAPVRRREHVAIDRHHLAYLNGLQKLNCVYCGYANGVLSYAREIASRTEAYWCPIKHARRVPDPHERMAGFADYGDADGFSGETERQRRRLGSRGGPPPG
ncbi:hypothetical protein HKCCSP123_12530 [Rhodobacterales bacterium HKCCSP123]|nr:hypothetical protein [Rhodobacterales bacterium HKCCSP123]